MTLDDDGSPRLMDFNRLVADGYWPFSRSFFQVSKRCDLSFPRCYRIGRRSLYNAKDFGSWLADIAERSAAFRSLSRRVIRPLADEIEERAALLFQHWTENFERFGPFPDDCPLVVDTWPEAANIAPSLEACRARAAREIESERASVEASLRELKGTSSDTLFRRPDRARDL
jgi:hypothetical protein